MEVRQERLAGLARTGVQLARPARRPVRAQPRGEFEESPFPNGTGRVEEVRYEALGTLSRPLSSNLDLQVAAGAEISRLARVDGDLPARKFFRPKGSVTLGWRPIRAGTSASSSAAGSGRSASTTSSTSRSSVDDRENAGNPDLVPPQSWEVEAEVGRELGAWGKTRLRALAPSRPGHRRRHPDRGSTARRRQSAPCDAQTGIESVSTIQFDPLGWKGAKLDITAGLERTSVRDPLTGEKRPISGSRTVGPTSSFGMTSRERRSPGAAAEYTPLSPNIIISTEVFRSWEGPWFVRPFRRAQECRRADRPGRGRQRLRRPAIFDPRSISGAAERLRSASSKRHDQLIGPIFSLSVKGTF